MLPNFSYVRPANLADAIQRLGEPGARAHAGGTDLLGCVRDRVVEAREIVSLGGIGELRGIRVNGDGSLRIGALSTIAEIAHHTVVVDRYVALAKAAASIGTPQIRNQGTIGGNLCQRPRCWYFRGDFACARKGGDTCYAMEGENQFHAIYGASTCLAVHPSDTATALVALGARLGIVGPRGARTVPVESFFVLPEQDLTRENVLAPGEILTEIVIPAPAPDSVSTYRKVRTRGAFDFAIASLAASLSFRQGRVAEARIVLGAAALKPWRAVEAEKMLVGMRLDPRTIASAYKVSLYRGLVEEVLETNGAGPRDGMMR